MAGFIYFTEEQKERVREIDLVAYLKKNGYKLKKTGSDYVCSIMLLVERAGRKEVYVLVRF